MKRRTVLSMSAAALASPMLAQAQAPTVVKWWYHFDNPQASPADLIAKFERENPGIKIQAESIPWGGGNDYYTRLYAALVAGTAPDCAMVKLANQSRLLQMRALEPLDAQIANWAGRQDIAANLWKMHRAPDGKNYYMPLQYVVLYLYYRTDMLASAGVQPPKTFDDFLRVSMAVNKGDVSAFGMRGGAGGHDHWGSFVLGGGANFEKGGMVSPKALAANRWFVELGTRHKLFPASAPTDGFRQIVENFKAGRTAMTIHHIGSANEMVQALGDKVSAVPVPVASDGKGWTSFGDESNAVFASSKVKDAAFKWCAFLSTGENNVAFNAFTGQLTVTNSGAAKWTLHPKRFVDSTANSTALMDVLPNDTKTADFTRTVWPQSMQRALLGQITPDAMMQAFDKHFHG